MVKYIKNFKKNVTECRANGWIKTDPFINHKVRLKVVKREFLNEEELIKIAETDFQIPRLNAVRDVFLFSCYTCLAYIDVQQLMNHQIVRHYGYITPLTQNTLSPGFLDLLTSFRDLHTCGWFGLPIFGSWK